MLYTRALCCEVVLAILGFLATSSGEYAEKMQRILTDPNQMKSLRLRARRRSEEFSGMM